MNTSHVRMRVAGILVCMGLLTTPFAATVIAAGEASRPDTPEPCLTCPGDLNGDYVVNSPDIQCFVNCLIDGVAAPPCTCTCADFNHTGAVDLDDVSYFVTELLTCTVCPYIADFQHSDCLSGTRGERTDCGVDEVVFTVLAGALGIDHDNAEYNCCLDDITVSLTAQGNVIHLDEVQVLTLPCFCMCCYDVQVVVANITPGTYLVQYCWVDYGFGNRCYEQEIVIP